LIQYGSVVTKTTDISSKADRSDPLVLVDAEHRNANLLVNAAGVFAPKPFLEHTEKDYDL